MVHLRLINGSLRTAFVQLQAHAIAPPASVVIRGMVTPVALLAAVDKL